MAEQAGPDHGRWLLSLREPAQAWVLANDGLVWWEDDGAGVYRRSPFRNRTNGYVDLVFSFGLARLGAQEASRELFERATGVLTAWNESHPEQFPGDRENYHRTHRLLLRAYQSRIQEALEGKPLTSALAEEWLGTLEISDRMSRYAIDRLRKHSHILEPDQRINPYRPWGARLNDFERALADLTDQTDRQKLVAQVEKMLAEVPKGVKGADSRARVLKAALEAAPRVGEDFGRRMLDQALPAYDALPEAKDAATLMEQAGFLEMALFVAGYFGLNESVQPLMGSLRALLRDPNLLQALHGLVRQAIRVYTHLRMADELDQFLQECKDFVLAGQDVSSLTFLADAFGPARLRFLLALCEGWLLFGWDQLARPVVEIARSLLLRGDLPAREQGQLACAYLAAAGLAPSAEARRRMEEVFRQLPGVRDTYSTATHFSVSQLDVVEAAVLAYAGRADIALP
jgi:hypothetical protein